jgi:hypothetical protein
MECSIPAEQLSFLDRAGLKFWLTRNHILPYDSGTKASGSVGHTLAPELTAGEPAIILAPQLGLLHFERFPSCVELGMQPLNQFDPIVLFGVALPPSLL